MAQTMIDFIIAHQGPQSTNVITKTITDGSQHHLLVMNDGEWLKVPDTIVTKDFVSKALIDEEVVDGKCFYRAYMPCKDKKDVLSMFE